MSQRVRWSGPPSLRRSGRLCALASGELCRRMRCIRCFTLVRDVARLPWESCLCRCHPGRTARKSWWTGVPAQSARSAAGWRACCCPLFPRRLYACDSQDRGAGSRGRPVHGPEYCTRSEGSKPVSADAKQPVPPTGINHRPPAKVGRSADPDVSRCHCGRLLIRCSGCQSLRCLDCDPYSSDDCIFDL